MVGGHTALRTYTKKHGLDMAGLKTGEAVVFINRRKDKMKCYAWNGVLSYLKIEEPGRVIDLNAIEQFPRAFDAKGHVDYVKALKISLGKTLAKNKYFATQTSLGAGSGES